MSPEESAKNIRILLCDLDGVFTDGGLYYDNNGKVTKRFHVQDGFGIKLAQAADLEVGVLTGLESEAVRKRIDELGIKEYYAGKFDKAEIINDISHRHNIQLQDIAFVGDDWVDAVPMSRVGLPVAVANAQPEIKDLATLLTEKPGGSGAVREVVNFILGAQNKMSQLWEKWNHCRISG